MKNPFLKRKLVNIKNIGENYYFERDNLIVDKFCPNCKKIILKEEDFCECGFFLKAAKNSAYWGVILSVFTVLGVILLIISINLDNFQEFALNKLDSSKVSFSSITPVNIQVMARLERSKYRDYIQTVYVKPKVENKLFILVKPNSWDSLNTESKEEILKEVKQVWIEVYKENHANSTQKPEVSFANPSD